MLRVGRTAMHDLARRHEATGGTDGDIAVIRVGHQFRVPRAWLEEKLRAPITWPPESAVAVSEPATARPTTNAEKRPPVQPTPRQSITRSPRSSRRLVDDSPTLFSV